jgi:DNA-binding PadR family transcriptional regulator
MPNLTPNKSEHPLTSRHAVKKLGKGYLRGIVLALLAEHPRYGYEILKAMADASDGWRPSPGTIYPILHDLHEHGLIAKKESDEEGRRRIIYKLCPKGRADLEKAALQHARFVVLMRNILGEHGGPHFPHPPAFDIDKALAKLEHTKLFLNEVAMLPDETTSKPETAIALLRNRLYLLEDHEKTVKRAIHLVKNTIQNLQKKAP